MVAMNVGCQNVDEKRVVRSRACERRLRKRRQEARLRLQLAADAALLAGHHASAPPSVLGVSSKAELEALRAEVAALRALVDKLVATASRSLNEPELKEELAQTLVEPSVEPSENVIIELPMGEEGSEDVNVDEDASLRRELHDAVTRSADLTVMLEEPCHSEGDRKILGQFLVESKEVSASLVVEMTRRGMALAEGAPEGHLLPDGGST